jgi:hypothetical protein
MNSTEEYSIQLDEPAFLIKLVLGLRTGRDFDDSFDNPRSIFTI